MKSFSWLSNRFPCEYVRYMHNAWTMKERSLKSGLGKNNKGHYGFLVESIGMN